MKFLPSIVAGTHWGKKKKTQNKKLMNDCSNCESYYYDTEASTGFPWWFSGKESAF